MQEAGVRFRPPITDHRSPSTCPAAFSLVEVTLALAVMAIGLIAILGLIPRGVQSGRDAADNTLAATIAHDIFNAIRTQPFTAVNLSAYGYPVTPYNLSQTILPPNPVYLDAAGFSTSVAADSYFRVNLTFQPESLVTPTVLRGVTATVTWPANPGVTWPVNTNVFVTEIASYQ